MKKSLFLLVILGFLQCSAPEVTQAALLRKQKKVKEITHKKCQGHSVLFFYLKLFCFFQQNCYLFSSIKLCNIFNYVFSSKCEDRLNVRKRSDHTQVSTNVCIY